MRKITLFSLVLVLSLILIGCTDKKNETADPKPEEKVELMVSAAVSLTDALDEIKELYEKEHAVKLTYNLQGSGSLAQQIQQGAPVDVFISANQEWMDTLEDEELIISTTRQDITGNKLVLITGTASDMAYSSVEDINAEEIEQIAIGNPESVPAGAYAEQVLKKLNMWEAFEDKIVLAKDVRQVLTYVETANVDIGFVYESDALSSDKIEILATAEDGTHDPVIYPGAILSDTKHEKEATDFLTFMASKQAQTILEKHGFRK